MIPRNMLSTTVAIATFFCCAKNAMSQFDGDYNDNGVVDTADYTIWPDTLGAVGTTVTMIGACVLVMSARRFRRFRLAVWLRHLSGAKCFLRISLSVAGLVCLLASPAIADPFLLIDLVRLGSQPVLDASGNWQFSVSVTPDASYYADAPSDSPDKGAGGGLATNFGLEVTDEHGSTNTAISNVNISYADLSAGETYENFPASSNNLVENPGNSPFGGLGDGDGVNAAGHQLDSFIGTIFFNLPGNKELYQFSAGRPATDSNFGGTTINVDIQGGLFGGTVYRLAQGDQNNVSGIAVGGAANFDISAAGIEFTFAVTPGDADFDGTVDGTDFLIWQRNAGSSGDWSNGDFDGNGDVNGDDLTILEANFGTGTLAATIVPEPTTCTLALAALCLAMSRRRAGVAACRNSLPLYDDHQRAFCRLGCGIARYSLLRL